MEDSSGFIWETFPVLAPKSPRSINPRREWERDISHNLRDLHEQTWGFTVFCTVYTPGSDAQFALFLSKLRTYVDYSIDSDLRPSQFSNRSNETPLEKGPNEDMKRRFINDIVESPDLEGANTDTVRDAFTKWLQEKNVDIAMHQLYTRHRVCIMVDAEVLDSMTIAPEDPSIEHRDAKAWVKVVEYMTPGEERWQGWGKLALERLCGFRFSVYGDEDVEGILEDEQDFD